MPLTWFLPHLFSRAPYQEPELHPSWAHRLSDHPLVPPVPLALLELALAVVEAELVPLSYHSPQTLE
jgi:hypothetical protein